MAIRSLPIRHLKAETLWHSFSRRARRVLQPAKPVFQNLLSMPLSVAGYVAVDIGVFQASAIAGWIVTGASLIWLEYLIADEEG